MTPFQVLALSCLGLLLAWELVGMLRGRKLLKIWLLRTAVWTAVAAAIAMPGLVQRIAVMAGIGRGADAVLYLFVCAYVATTLAFYAWQVRLQTQITRLVRMHALDNARRGQPADAAMSMRGE